MTAETTTTRSIVSDGLDMIQYPIGTGSSGLGGDHIMGVVALAWCTDDALDRWGEAWARHGSTEMRFRSHLTAGLDLAIAAEHYPERTELTVTGSDSTVYATATLRPGPSIPKEPSGRPPSEPFPVLPRAALLDRYELRPLGFDYVAERDLRLAERLAHSEFWASHGCAHPAWLASASNAILRHTSRSRMAATGYTPA